MSNLNVSNIEQIVSLNYTDLTVQTSAGLGYGQIWRATGKINRVWYQNTTGRPIYVFYSSTTAGGDMFVNTSPSTTGWIMVGGSDGDSGTWDNGAAVIPNNYYYYLNTGGIRFWSELS